jgi:hypothetical protein
MADSTCLTTKTNTWLHRGASAIVASSLVFAAYRIHGQLSDEHVWERRPDGHAFTPGTLFITEHVRTGAKVGEVLRTHHQLACSIANAYRPALVSMRYNSDAGAHQQREWCRPRSITSLFVQPATQCPGHIVCHDRSIRLCWRAAPTAIQGAHSNRARGSAGAHRPMVIATRSVRGKFCGRSPLP